MLGNQLLQASQDAIALSEVIELKYDLERLGSSGFQDLAGALAISYFGPQVQSLGSGRDGGRDMECNGTLTWAGEDQQLGEEWTGHTVFQVKHHEKLGRNADNVTWLWGQIRGELEKWASPTSGRGAVPDYFVFVTNVPLTPVPETGGLATVEKQVEKFLADLSDSSSEDALDGKLKKDSRDLRLAKFQRMRRVQKWRIWDANQVNALIDASDAVRRAFDGFLTVGDVLADLSIMANSNAAEAIGSTLHVHARGALIGERSIYFNEAGAVGPGLPVDDVVVDLPVLVRRPTQRANSGRVLRFALARGDQMLRPSLSIQANPRHIVIAGAPGNGKTTVSKFLVQCFRASLLREGDMPLADSHRAAIAGTEAALQRLGRNLPRNRRWPVRVDLAEYADAQRGMIDHATLVHWISTRINAHSNAEELKRWALSSWLQQWPSFIALDGLDEVSEPKVRQRLIETIKEFASTAEADDWDTLILVTTRPTGYMEEMPEDLFERIDLADLSLPEALAYGGLVTRLRLGDDFERIDRVSALLRQASENEALKHLLRTPLQVAIMTVVAESTGQFAADRYSLFWGYYDALERREQGKPGGFGSLLREHRLAIQELHEQVGLELQKRSESATDATAVLSQDDLREIAWRVLDDMGHDPRGADARLLEDIVTAATDRLVLLVPRGSNGYGFDIRSLQELMAARRLTSGPIEEVVPRLEALAASPHWRNTWVFAAGRYFSEPQSYLRSQITDLVLEMDDRASMRLGRICPVGPYLAWDLIDDGMAFAQPKCIERLVEHGMSLLQSPAPLDSIGWAEKVARAADAQEQVKTVVRDHIRSALGSTEVPRNTAQKLQSSIRTVLDGALSSSLSLQGIPAIRPEPGRSLPAEPEPNWSELDEILATFGDDQNAESIEELRGLVRRAATGTPEHDDADLLRPALTDPSTAEVVEMALASVAAASPQLVTFLRDTALPPVYRMDKAEELNRLGA